VGRNGKKPFGGNKEEGKHKGNDSVFKLKLVGWERNPSKMLQEEGKRGI